MKIHSFLRLAVLAAVGLAGAIAIRASGQVVVSPGAQSTTEGSGANIFPFSIGFLALKSQRYQQVYAASDFSAITRPELITQIAFRPAPVGGRAFTNTLPDVQIDLSTTTAPADGLSTTFANNVGADDIMVHRGALALSSAFIGPPRGPKDFDILIPLSTPFLYNPARGNLLLDVRNFGGGRTTGFDVELLKGDAVSRIYTPASGSVGDSSGVNDGNSEGLVTQFTFVAASVPEPGGWGWFAAMIVSVSGAFALRRLRKNVR